jgi:hypothetical protein
MDSHNRMDVRLKCLKKKVATSEISKKESTLLEEIEKENRQ